MLRVAGKALLTLLIIALPLWAQEDSATYRGLANFTRILDLIERNYVTDVDAEKLSVGAIEGMLKTLDPYSIYLSPDRFKEFEEGTTGEFGGVGMEITSKNGVLTVIAPIEDTPASRAGIKSGDMIINIEGETARDMGVYEAVKRLRGPKGSKVTITVQAAKDSQLRDIELTRSVIRVNSVKSELKQPGIGYIKITHFQDKTNVYMGRALRKLELESGGKLKGLVLDLRNNPGGLLNQAVDITDRFIDEGLIVSVKGRANDQNMDYYATKNGDMFGFPIVVLVNEGSASASEVVAEALQDQKRATILGTKSFGKGSVQTIIRLEDGSGLKLTTARFYAPSGRSINEVGVTPDVIVENEDNSGEDTQLKRALELLRQSV